MLACCECMVSITRGTATLYYSGSKTLCLHAVNGVNNRRYRHVLQRKQFQVWDVHDCYHVIYAIQS